MSEAATGQTTPTNLFRQKPVPRLAARTAAQKRGWGSSSSRARRKAHIARAIVNVNITSGIRIRVNRKIPAHVAMHKTEYRPARLPKAHVANAAVSQARAMTESAIGILAAQSDTPKIL